MNEPGTFIYVVICQDSLEGTFGLSAHWMRKHAEEAIMQHRIQSAQWEVQPTYVIENVRLDPPIGAVDDYFEKRGLKDPETIDAFLFLVSELGETADALAESRSEGWVRNNPDQKHKHPEKEGGDIFMMLVKFMSKLGHDPIRQMFNNFDLKGWKNDG